MLTTELKEEWELFMSPSVYRGQEKETHFGAPVITGRQEKMGTMKDSALHIFRGLCYR
jgi:hypothetical protein